MSRIRTMVQWVAVATVFGLVTLACSGDGADGDAEDLGDGTTTTTVVATTTTTVAPLGSV